MQEIREVLRGQVIQLASVVAFGFFLGLFEWRFAVRDNKKYREHWIDALGVFCVFLGACSFALSVAALRKLPMLHPLQTTINELPWYVLVPAASLAADLINYLAHRLLHSKHFWNFHRWHHSPEQLFWFSGFRGSFVHIFLLGFKNILILSVSNLNPVVLATIGVQGLYAQMAGHVNFDLHIPILDRILVTPQYHRIHHAFDRKLHDSNYSFVWTFWDKIFGTQTLPESVPAFFPLGLSPSEKVSLWRMLLG